MIDAAGTDGDEGSLAGALAAIRREIPPALLADPGGRRVLDVARTLPAALARRPTGFELRLSGPASADLFVGAVPRASDGRALLAWARRAELTELARGLEAWRSGFGWLAWYAKHMGLGFDATTEGRRVPPCVYLTPLGADDDGPVEVPTNAFHASPRGLVAALAALSGSPPEPRAIEDVERLLAVLPPFAEIFCAGAMISRATARAPRLVIRRLRPDGIGAVLVALGQGEAAEHLVPVAAELRERGARLALSLDVGAAASAAAGVEAHAGRHWTEGSPEGWAPVLDALVARGLAEPDRAEAATGLPGARGPDGPVFGIGHVKIAADSAGLRPAKLYLGVVRAAAAVAARGEFALARGAE